MASSISCTAEWNARRNGMASLDYRLVSRPELLDLVDEAWARDSLPDDCECRHQFVCPLARALFLTLSVGGMSCVQQSLCRGNLKMLPSTLTRGYRARRGLHSLRSQSAGQTLQCCCTEMHSQPGLPPCLGAVEPAAVVPFRNRTKEIHTQEVDAASLLLFPWLLAHHITTLHKEMAGAKGRTSTEL